MSQQYNINSSLHGVNGYGRQFPQVVYNCRLAATTDTSFTVPGNGITGLPSNGVGAANTYLIKISYESPASAANSHVFVALNQAAAAPAGNTFAAATSIINPDALVCKAGDVLHFFAPTADTDVAVEVWALQE